MPTEYKVQGHREERPIYLHRIALHGDKTLRSQPFWLLTNLFMAPKILGLTQTQLLPHLYLT